MEHIVLMGGPCSGQSETLAEHPPVYIAVDEAGTSHLYVRTELTVAAKGDEPPTTIYRRAPPAPPH